MPLQCLHDEFVGVERLKLSNALCAHWGIGERTDAALRHAVVRDIGAQSAHTRLQKTLLDQGRHVSGDGTQGSQGRGGRGDDGRCLGVRCDNMSQRREGVT